MTRPPGGATAPRPRCSRSSARAARGPGSRCGRGRIARGKAGDVDRLPLLLRHVVVAEARGDALADRSSRRVGRAGIRLVKRGRRPSARVSYASRRQKPDLRSRATRGPSTPSAARTARSAGSASAGASRRGRRRAARAAGAAGSRSPATSASRRPTRRPSTTTGRPGRRCRPRSRRRAATGRRGARPTARTAPPDRGRAAAPRRRPRAQGKRTARPATTPECARGISSAAGFARWRT